METIVFFPRIPADLPAPLPRVCRANLALPESIMLEDCRCCRRQLARTAGRPELLERLFEHMANLDCSGAVAMRKAPLAKAHAPESKDVVLFLCNSGINF